MTTTSTTVRVGATVSPEKVALKRIQDLGNFIANMVAILVLALVGMAVTTFATVALTLVSPLVFLVLVHQLRRLDARRRLNAHGAG
jgi:hypothetical protein